jgi:hypothetical protein
LLLPFDLFYGDLVYFVAIWYILWLFGTFFPVWVRFNKKNLATPTASRAKAKRPKMGLTHRIAPEAQSFIHSVEADKKKVLASGKPGSAFGNLS